MPRFLGDSVTASSAVQMIRSIYPRNPIFLFTWPHVAELFAGRDFCRCQVLIDGRYTKPKRSLWSVARELARHRFKRVYHMRNSFSDALVCALAGIREQIGYAKNGRTPFLSQAYQLDSNYHYQFRYSNLVNLAHGNMFKEMPEISLNAGKKTYSVDKPQVVVYFGGRYKLSRHYPFALASQALLLIASEIDCHFVLLGDRLEVNENAALAQFLVSHNISVDDITATTTVAELADVVNGAQLVISIDSGQMHIAAALKIPYVAVVGFGTTPWSCVEPKVAHGIHLTSNDLQLDLDQQITQIKPIQIAEAAIKQLNSQTS